MKLTAIKAQVKRADRVSIYIDGAYAFSLSHGQLLEYRLHTGLEIDAAQAEELAKASEAGKLYDRLLRYVLVRPRSQREVQQYIRRKRYDQALSSDSVAKLMTRGYIDDAVFAKAWVQNRSATKPVSARRLRLELRQKGISDDLIARAMADGVHNQTAALQTLIAKKQRQIRYTDSQKLKQYLVRQGFGYDEVVSALADSA